MAHRTAPSGPARDRAFSFSAAYLRLTAHEDRIQGSPVSNANAATLTQVIEALLARIQARDSGLDLSLLSRIIVTDQLAATEQQLAAPRRWPANTCRASSPTAMASPCSSTAPACGRPSKATAPRSPRLIHHLHKGCWRLHDARQPQAAAADHAAGPRAWPDRRRNVQQEYRINRRGAT